MKSFAFAARKLAFRRLILTLGCCVALVTLSPRAIEADLKTDSQKQFERAVKMRTMLEGYLEKDRSLSDYQQTVLAFRKVYLVAPDAPDATQALTAEAELYEAMGRLFDARFFKDAVARYNFLLKQYPETRYRAEALFAIGKIQKDDFRNSDDAQATFREFLKRYPRSDKAAEAQRALHELVGSGEPGRPAAARAGQGEPNRVANVGDAQPDLIGQAIEPRVSEQRVASVTKVQTWNSPDSTRIIVTLNDTIQYESARVASPDRIYFNLYKAKVGANLTRKALEVNDGVLESVRIAQNTPDTVRLVLNVNGERDYSVFLLGNPYRLVIDLHAQATTSTAKELAASPPSNDAPSPVPASALTVGSNRDSAAPAAKATAEKSAAKLAASSLEVGSNRESPAEPAMKGTSQPAAPGGRLAERTLLPLPKDGGKTTALVQPPPVAKPTRDGQRSLTRALGLKISKIVIDAGHGGHDTGTVGPHGLMEKDLCLDVAFRLGGLIEEKLPGAEVIYTRKDDSFVSLEERTNIANQAQADLFISIHANSSHDSSARGVETYYLNFASTEEAMEVASRENALSQESLHDLQDLIQKIAQNDKIEESKEFATDVQDSLSQRLQLVTRSEKNRGVKKAPFVVLIGANMPSILTEISFVSNPYDEKLLRKADQRQRIADGLYRGISSYLDNLNSLSNNKQKLVSATPAEGGAVASNANPK